MKLCSIFLSVSGSFHLAWHSPGLPGGSSGEESACQHGSRRRGGLDPWVGEIPWRRKWQPTPAFLAGWRHKQTSLAGYSTWGCKKSNTTKHASNTKCNTLQVNPWCHKDNISFLGWVIFHCLYIPHFLSHSSMDGQTDCFHILATVSNAAVNTGV